MAGCCRLAKANPDIDEAIFQAQASSHQSFGDVVMTLVMVDQSSRK